MGCVDGVDYRFKVLFACLVPCLVTLWIGIAHLCRKKSKGASDPSARTSAVLYLFDLVDADKSETIDCDEFLLLLEQMEKKVASKEEALVIMKQLGAQKKSVIGGMEYVLTRDELVTAASKNQIGKVLGNKWVTKTENGREKSGRLATLLLLLFMLHAPVSQRLCHYFACVQVGNGDNAKSFLRADYKLTCMEGDHLSFAPFIFFFLILFTFCFPLVILFVLCSKRKKLRTPGTQRQFGFLYNRFTVGSEMWGKHVFACCVVVLVL